MEMHLKPIDQDDWARETIKLLSDKAIQSFLPVERFLTQPNGYLALRRTLIANCPNNLANKQVHVSHNHFEPQNPTALHYYK